MDEDTHTHTERTRTTTQLANAHTENKQGTGHTGQPNDPPRTERSFRNDGGNDNNNDSSSNKHRVHSADKQDTFTSAPSHHPAQGQHTVLKATVDGNTTTNNNSNLSNMSSTQAPVAAAKRDNTSSSIPEEETGLGNNAPEPADVLNERLIDEEYKIWKKNTPFLYDFVMTHSLEWPSLTCQWLPTMKSAGDQLSQHSMLIGTHTTGEQNYIMVASVNLPKSTSVIDNRTNNSTNANGNSKEGAGSNPTPNGNGGNNPVTLPAARYDSEKNEVGGFGHAHMGVGKIEIRMKIKHEGEVNRARYMPQNHFIVASRGPSPEIYIWDFSKHPSFPKEDESPFCPQGVCIGHRKEGYGMSWSKHTEGQLISGSEDCTIKLWDINAAIGPKTGSGTQIKPISTFKGHSSVVEDVDWHHRDPYMIGSVGDDRAIRLWDVREKDATKAVHVVENAHSGDVNCIAFNPINEYVLATGSADNTVAVWDMRNLKA